jgi:all-trans-retinol 13,14-reductase
MSHDASHDPIFSPVPGAAQSPDRRNTLAWPTPELGSWPGGDRDHHVIVVGAGIGGLSAAALLARRGLKVLVVESHDRPGGYCSSWTRSVRLQDAGVGRFTFDAGVQDISGTGRKGPVGQLLRTLGVEDRIQWRRVHHRYILDGFSLDVPEDPAELVRRACRLFPDEATGVSALLSEIEAVYRDMNAEREQTGGVPALPTSLQNMLDWSARHPRAARWMRRPFGDMLDAFVESRDLKRLLTTIAEYVTDDPGCLTAAEMVPLYGYYFDGGHYPAGGSQSLADVLRAAIEERGGSVLLKTRVRLIAVEAGSVAGIVTAAGAVHRARIVIANGDVTASLTGLIGPHLLAGRYGGRLAGMRRGPSAVLVSLALDSVPDIPARVFLKAGDLAFGIGNPSVLDPSLAPPGHAALTFLHLVPEAATTAWFRMSRPAYRAEKKRIADRLIAAAEAAIPDLRRRILYRQTAAPPTFTRYTSAANGSIYGAARNQWHPGPKTPVPGLVLAGAACQTGPGIEAVVISGVRAADAIAPG